MGDSDWNKGWGGLQDGPDHPNTKLTLLVPNDCNALLTNLHTNVNLDVLYVCIHTNHK